jgi:class 3 adenylate cyclase
VDERALPRGTVTFLFTDIEGSTGLARQLGAEYGRVRSDHRGLLRAAFARHRGYEIDTAGDGFFVAFERASEAVAAAIDGQRALQDAASGEGVVPRVRMGLHTAEAHLDEDSYVGVGVSRAARICAVGHGSQILLSNATAGIIEDLGDPDIELRDLGEHALKDIGTGQRLFQVVAPGLQSDFPPLNTPGTRDRRGQIVTLLQCDLAGWRRVVRTLGDQASLAVAFEYHRIARQIFDAHQGHGVDYTADNVLAVFGRPADAITAAVALRSALQNEAWFPDRDPPAPRIAINSGRAAGGHDQKQLGTVALRTVLLTRIAEEGQILVSHATEALLAGERLPVILRDLGDRALDDEDPPARVFEIADRTIAAS